jgi:transcriptional regulator with XRE-family HTH domain
MITMTDIENKSIPTFPITHLAERLQKAREYRGISLKDCSNLLGIPTNKLQNYEKGKFVPSLTELEALSYIYGVPLNALFFPEKFPDLFKVPDAEQLKQLLQIRQHIISTTLQIAFVKTGKKIKEISKETDIPISKIKRYFSEGIDISIDDLQKLSSVLTLDFKNLMDTESPIGLWQEFEKLKYTYTQLPENAREFMNKKENWPFMNLIEKIKLIDPEKLKSIADSIRQLEEITRKEQETLSQVD